MTFYQKIVTSQTVLYQKEKLKIIEQAEVLQEAGDVLRASRDLNTLHQLWKNDLGPVAKEHRDVLWARFQEASKVIQAKRQAYQKDMVGAMKENLYLKETLLKEYNSQCIKLIEESLLNESDDSIKNKLSNAKDKLLNQTYNVDTFTTEINKLLTLKESLKF